MSDRLCVIQGCRDLGEHLDDCTSDRCKGCRPRAVEKGFVCASDRTGLAAMLADIAESDGQLREDEDPVDHQDWVRVPVPTSDPARLRPWRWLRPAREAEDVLARVLPAGIVRSGLGAGARVSGSKEPAAPTDLDRLDLAAPPRHGEVIPTWVPATQVVEVPVRRRFVAVEDGRPVVREEKYTARQRVRMPGEMVEAADQVGFLPVAAILDSWVRVWREDLFPDHQLPRPAVPELVRWLADRLATACGEHPAIDEFAEDIRSLRSVLRGKLGLNAAPRERCDGVVCKGCDRMALFRDGGLVSCGYCGLNYSEAEYREWTGLLAGQARRMAA